MPLRQGYVVKKEEATMGRRAFLAVSLLLAFIGRPIAAASPPGPSDHHPSPVKVAVMNSLSPTELWRARKPHEWTNGLFSVLYYAIDPENPVGPEGWSEVGFLLLGSLDLGSEPVMLVISARDADGIELAGPPRDPEPDGPIRLSIVKSAVGCKKESNTCRAETHAIVIDSDGVVTVNGKTVGQVH